MQNKQLSLKHLVREPSVKTEKPPLLLLLHGVGSNEEDLFGLADYLDDRFFIVSARGPYTLGYGAYAWFHVQFTPNGPVIEPEEAESSRLALLNFIGEVVEAYGPDAQRVYLMGFSQGAIMSMSLTLTAPEKLAGVVAMSGRTPPEVLSKAVPPERLKGLPIFVAHGTADQVLPIHYGRQTRDILSELPVKLTYREYPMAHQISAESLADIAGWLKHKLDGQED